MGEQMRAALWGIGIVFGWGVVAVAAIPKAQVSPTRILVGSGVAQGGKSGMALALMDFRHSASKNGKMERLVLDFGSADLKEAKGLVGYYHAELQENPSRLVLELPQTYASRLPEKEILKRLQKSNFVRGAQIGFDRNLQSMTMVFQFKGPVQARVARIASPDTTGKIVIDLAADNPQARAARRAGATAGARAGARREPAVSTRGADAATARRTAPGAGSRADARTDGPAGRVAAPAGRAAAAPGTGSRANVRTDGPADRVAAPSFIDSAPVAPPAAHKPAPRKAGRPADGLTDADRAAAASVQSPGANR